MTIRHPSKRSVNDKFDMHSTEQFSSEQRIFHTQYRDQNKLLIHIPALSPKDHNYPNLFITPNTKKPLRINKELLETTSKIPLNVGLDNVLFVSTLEDYWTRTAAYRMKRHISNSGAQNLDSSVHATAARRYSHPDTNKAQQQYHAAIENPSLTSSSSSSSSNKTQTSHEIRRLSFQSDAASTELIRRFSSESTSSSLSSISSFILESHNKLLQQKQQKVQETALSSDAQTSHPVAVAESTVNLIQAAAAAAASETKELDRDPGHACVTMHSPSKKMQHLQGTSIKEEEPATEQLPVWADPIKAKENPTRFQYTKSYLKQRDIPYDSSLPLAKPCVFYFIDNSIPEEYSSAVKPAFECNSVWGFAARWRAFKERYNKKPSQLAAKQNIFCFIKGVAPMWEDPVNKNGGRFTITVDKIKLLNDIFEWILCAFVGGSLYEDGVVGIAVSKRYRGDRIEIWLDQSASDEMIPEFKNKLCHLLASTCHDQIKAGRYKKHFS